MYHRCVHSRATPDRLLFHAAILRGYFEAKKATVSISVDAIFSEVQSNCPREKSSPSPRAVVDVDEYDLWCWGVVEKAKKMSGEDGPVMMLIAGYFAKWRRVDGFCLAGARAKRQSVSKADQELGALARIALNEWSRLMDKAIQISEPCPMLQPA